MTNKTPNHSAKPGPESQKSKSTQSPSGQKPDHEGKRSGSDQTPERMETFPKPNTIPNKWDLSSFSKK